MEATNIDYYWYSGEFCYKEKEVRDEVSKMKVCEAVGEILKTRDITAHVWVKEVIP